MYSIGGVAGARNPNNAECFTAEPDTLFANGFANGGQNETCATYNLLKLSRQLFLFDPDAKYMDYYEQALYNHILASVAENNPGNTYHVPLNPGARKQFGNARHGRVHLLQRHRPGKQHQAPGLHLFPERRQPGPVRQPLRALHAELDGAQAWSSRRRTNFPYADTTRLTLTGGGQFDIKVRVPRWATQGFFVKINGQEQAVKAVPGTYLTLSGNWKDGDTIELRMPLPLLPGPGHGPAQHRQPLLRPGSAGRRGIRTAHRLAARDAGCGDIGKSITGDPAHAAFQYRRRGLQAVLRDLRPVFGVSGRDLEIVCAWCRR